MDPADFLDDQALQDTPALADVLAELRSWGTGPAPAPTPALMALLEGDPVTAPAPQRTRRTKKMLVTELLSGLAAKLAGLGLAAKAAMGLGMAAAATTTAGVAGVLPEPAQNAIATVVEAVSPFEVGGTGQPGGTVGVDVSVPGIDVSVPDVTLPGDETDGDTGGDTGGDNGGDTAGQPANHGACVSAIARDKSTTGRAHGAAVSAAARSDCGKTTDSPTSPTTTSTTIDTTTTTVDDDTTSASSNRGRGNNGNGNGGNSNGGNGGNSGSNGNRGSGRN
jgi:uncharacterized membrane protein YgcG